MSLRKFDVFPKLDNEYRVGTTTGGLLSICSILATIILSYVEISSFFHPPVRQRLIVDAERPTELDGMTISSKSQPRLDVMLDVTFPSVQCSLLHFDVIDSFTQMPMPLDDVESTFIRYDSKGASLGNLPADYLSSKPSDTCGPCHIAGNVSEQCCKSCQDVFKVYREKDIKPPELKNIPQCKEVYDRISQMEGEGCRVVSKFRAVRVGGEFHLSPGLSWFNQGWHVHDLSVFSKKFEDLNLTHTVNRLQFVDSNTKMPLDGFQNVQEKPGMWRVVYTADILAGNFSVSRFNMYDGTRLVPGIIWKYDVSPISATTYLDKEPFMHLMTRLLTVIGGVLGMFRFVDQILYYSRKGKNADKIDE